MIPNAVAGKHIMDEVSMLQAWREYLVLYSCLNLKALRVLLLGDKSKDIYRRLKSGTRFASKV